MNNFKQFRMCNLKGCIERADDLLVAAKEMNISHEDLMALAKAQMLTNMEDSDHWESVAWHLVFMEAFERQVREEDPTVQPPPSNWNGGFSYE